MVLDSAGMFGRQVDWRQHAWWSHSAACILLSKTDPIFHLSCMILSRVHDPTAVPFWIHFGENVQRLLCVLQDSAEVDTRCRHQAVLSHMSVTACSIFMCFMSSLITLLFYSSLGLSSTVSPSFCITVQHLRWCSLCFHVCNVSEPCQVFSFVVLIWSSELLCCSSSCLERLTCSPPLYLMRTV